MTYEKLTFKKIDEPYVTAYHIIDDGNNIGIVGKRLSGGFAIYWECRIGESIGVSGTRKGAVQSVLDHLNAQPNGAQNEND